MCITTVHFAISANKPHNSVLTKFSASNDHLFCPQFLKVFASVDTTRFIHKTDSYSKFLFRSWNITVVVRGSLSSTTYGFARYIYIFMNGYITPFVHSISFLLPILHMTHYFIRILNIFRF